MCLKQKNEVREAMDEINRYELQPEVKEKYLPIIKAFIDELENYSGCPYDLKKDFSGTELNPYTLSSILKSLGYENIDLDRNGWQMDFWWYFSKSGCKSIQISGSGIIFEMFLQGLED